VTPQTVAGETIDPQVSVPMAKGSRPAETAEAEPAEEPLEPCAGRQGLRVMPLNQTSPQASSPMVSLATSTAPAAPSFLITDASMGIICSLKGTLPQVVL